MADDKRIALTAVVVSGVIGIASPLIAWRSSAEIQDSVIRNTRIQSDLSELRSVLDDALADLNTLESRAKEKGDVWLEFTEGSIEPEQVKQAQRTLRRAVERADANATRIRIRLGQPGVHNLYWFAYQSFRELGECTPTVLPDSESVGRLAAAASELLENGRGYRGLFSDLSYATVRSHLPENEQIDAPTEAQIRKAVIEGKKNSGALPECETLRHAG